MQQIDLGLRACCTRRSGGMSSLLARPANPSSSNPPYSCAHRGTRHAHRAPRHVSTSCPSANTCQLLSYAPARLIDALQVQGVGHLPRRTIRTCICLLTSATSYHSTSITAGTTWVATRTPAVPPREGLQSAVHRDTATPMAPPPHVPLLSAPPRAGRRGSADHRGGAGSATACMLRLIRHAMDAVHF